MANLSNAFPASLRRPVESSQFSDGLAAHARKPALMAKPTARAAVVSKSRFARLPQEPEDARLTGVTRSLNRRLLALNIQGSLLTHRLAPAAVFMGTKIA